VLPLLVALYCVLTLLLIMRVPVGAAPDELAHLEYVKHLATQSTLPVFKTVGGSDPGYEFHQPPLYYAVCAPLWQAAGERGGPHFCRLVSLLCGALTLVLLWRAVAALFPNKSNLPPLATGFAALWPLHQGVGASAGNDALAGLICAAIFAVIARASNRAWQTRDAILLGILTGLGLLTKTTCLAIGLVAMGAAWSLARQGESDATRETGSTRRAILQPCLALAVALLFGGWWLARNQMRYGDPFALGAFNAAFGKTSPGPAMFLAAGVSLLDYLRITASILFCTAWGFFGGPNTAIRYLNPFGTQGPPPALLPVVRVMLVPMLICAAASGIALWGVSRWVRTWRDCMAGTRAALAWWFIGLLLVALAWAQFNTRYFQAQARYFHPALLPLALAFALGWRQALGDFWKGRALWIFSILFGCTLAALTLANAFGWRTLA